MLTHAAVPTVDIINEKIWRIYFASRDADNRSLISFIEVEAGKPSNILYVHDKPILPLGKLGTFDDNGLMPSWIVTVNSIKYLYYIGWNTRTTVPYHNAIGLAISDDSGVSFRRYSDGPIFGLTYLEPYFTASSCILIENDIWRNWYLSCTKWEIINGIAEPYYHLKYAESLDGINWTRNGQIAIDYKNMDEAGIVRASVLKENGKYLMWYSYRSGTNYRVDKSKSYRIGYAESYDGHSWARKDNLAGIDVSENGWDSEMIEYPHVIEHNKQKYMFYNGNGFGKTGFGYAMLED
jgi:hypothetical protein